MYLGSRHVIKFLWKVLTYDSLRPLHAPHSKSICFFLCTLSYIRRWTLFRTMFRILPLALAGVWIQIKAQNLIVSLKLETRIIVLLSKLLYQSIELWIPSNFSTIHFYVNSLSVDWELPVKIVKNKRWDIVPRQEFKL